MDYKNHIQRQRRSEEARQKTSSSAVGDKGIFLEDNRHATVIQQKTITALENSTSDTPIQKKENNTGLPDSLKSGIESLSGYAMDDVKVHYNSNQPAQLNAHAYAQGTDIHLATGQEKHLPHEAWHVVQQKQGRVQPTKQLKSKVNINDDDGLEKEADEMGEKALQFQSKEGLSVLQTVLVSKRTAQRYSVPEDEVEGSFTSQVSRDKVGGGKTFLNDAGDGAQLETKDTSKVRVAVTGKMAVEDSDKSARQAKFFYADGDILRQANDAMEAIESPISFKTGDNTIKVHDSNGIEHTLDLIIPIKNEGKESEKEGTDIRIPENCNEAACTITNIGGGGQNRFEGKFRSDGDDISAPSGVVGQDLVARMGAFLPAYLKVKEYEASSSISKFFSNEPTVEKELLDVTRDTSLESRDKITGYKDGLTPSRLKAREEDMKDRIGGYYSKEFLNKSGSKEIIDQLGINESAAPDAGDAMAIFSIGKTIGDVDGDFSVMDYRTGNYIDNPAPYHFATVIARSGADYITMENYVRRNEEADTHAPAALDPRYFFRMYGPEAQSFHSENVDRFPNAMTLALSKPVQQVAQLQSDASIPKKRGYESHTMQMKEKVNINDDEVLETEADVMGAKALQMKLNLQDSPIEKRTHNAPLPTQLTKKRKNKSKGGKKKQEKLTISPSSILDPEEDNIGVDYDEDSDISYRSMAKENASDSRGSFEENYEKPKLFWRGDSRGPEAVFETGFTTKNERDGITKKGDNQIIWREGGATDDILPASAICLAKDIRGSAFFPLTGESEFYMYAVAKTNVVNTFEAQKSAEAKETKQSNYKREDRYGYDPEYDDVEDASAVWQFQEYAAHRVKPMEILACFKVKRRTIVPAQNNENVAIAGIQFKLKLDKVAPIHAISAPNKREFRKELYKLLEEAEQIASKYQNFYPEENNFLSYMGIVKPSDEDDLPQNLGEAKGKMKQIEPIVIDE